jgi:DNA helicase HerA-like ATPase
MLNVPGARALSEDLIRIIRLQRHYGARVVVSTQEPVLLTDLIALCSIAVIHRFSSPEWLHSLKKHIPILSASQDSILGAIESLRTGTALVYSSNAVLGKKENGDLVKGTGRLLKVSIRKRVTADGGQSVLCV